MTVTIRGENVNMSSELEEFVTRKVEKLNRYLPNISSIHVDLAEHGSSRGPDTVSAQITVRHSRGAILRTEEKMDKTDNGSVKSALSSAVDKMYRRIRRFKEKPRSKRLRDRYIASVDEITTAEELPEELEDEMEFAPDATQLEPQIIRRKVVEVGAMNEEEAIEQMELLGHNFFVYYNPDSRAINVVYRRTGGGYGVLQPIVE